MAPFFGGALPPNTNNFAAFPTNLSQLGAFSNTTNLTPVAGMVPYDVNTPLWSDNASKTRWMAIPSGQTLGFNAQGIFNVPIGSEIGRAHV